MKLKLSRRKGLTKSELTQIRFAKGIPSVVYRKGGVSDKVCVDGDEMHSILRTLRQGFLPTTIFQLDLDGNVEKAIIKEIQYHPTTYQILHLDFLRLVENEKVEIKVPVVCTGQVECVGIKLGGVLRRVIRHLKIKCLPKDIPQSLEVDIRELNIGDVKRVSDVEINENLRFSMAQSEIILVIAKR